MRSIMWKQRWHIQRRMVLGITVLSCLFGTLESQVHAIPITNLTTPVIDNFPRIQPDLLILPNTNLGNVSLMWDYPAADLIDPKGSPVVAADGTVYLGYNQFVFTGFVGMVSAVTREGKSKWNNLTSDQLLSSPTVGPDGTLYMGVGSVKYNEGKFIAMNPDGMLKWSVSIGLVDAKPVFGSDGTIYVAVKDGTLYALHSNDGTKLWSSKVGFKSTAYMAIGKDGTIFLGNESNVLFAVKPNGSIKWTYQAEGLVNTVPALGADGTIYLGAADSKLYAISPSGTKQSEYTFGGNPFSPVIGSDGTIYIGASDQTLYALQPNLTLKWKAVFNKAITSTVIGPNGSIHLLTASGMVHALNPSDGSTQWRYGINTPDMALAPTIGEDGTVYASGMKEAKLNLYALRVKVNGITLNKTQATLQTGASESLSAALSPNNAPNKKVTWSSSKNGVASVDNEGNVTAVSSGTATITARTEDGGLSATCEVTVTNPAGTIEVQSISIQPAELSVKVGHNGKLKGSVLPGSASNQGLLWSSSNPGIAQVNDSGQVTGIAPGRASITAKTVDGGFTAASQITVLQGTTTAPGSDAFTDIEGHWASEEIARAYELHITNGYPDFTFRPNGSITRAEFVVMLMNGLKPELQPSDLGFIDSDKIGIWAQTSTSQAVQLGIVSGYPDGTFRPEANITHAEMAAMVFKALGIPLSAVTTTSYSDDSDIPEWARGAVSTVEKTGIIIVGGKTTGPFAPTDLSTRAEAAAWIVKMMDIKNKK